MKFIAKKFIFKVTELLVFFEKNVYHIPREKGTTNNCDKCTSIYIRLHVERASPQDTFVSPIRILRCPAKPASREQCPYLTCFGFGYARSRRSLIYLSAGEEGQTGRASLSVRVLRT